MARESLFVDGLRRVIDERLLYVNTAIEGRVTAINHTVNTVDVQPLIRTRKSDGSQETYPEMVDVPYQILSANAGNARITFPIAIGDLVTVIFSQRDNGHLAGSSGSTPVNAVSNVTHGLYPALAIPCFFTEATAQPVDPTNVVIENGGARISLSPSGDITMNGATVTSDGDFVTASGISLNEHVHGGVQSGGSLTREPESSPI